MKRTSMLVLFVTLGLFACGGPDQPVESDCANAPNCGQCASMGNAGGSCGWCIEGDTQRCLPGSSGSAPQSCTGQWVWTPDECTAAVSGEDEPAAQEDATGEAAGEEAL